MARPAFIERWGEAFLNTDGGRTFFAVGAVALSHVARAGGRPAFSAAVPLWAERLLSATGDAHLPAIIRRHNRALLKILKRSAGENFLRDAMAGSSTAEQIRRQFRAFDLSDIRRLRFPRPNDDPRRQGDLLILKAPGGNREKGVLLIKYNEAFHRAAALFHLDQMAEHFRLVLEPSFWGYQDPAILLFLNLNTEVIVQCQSHSDREFISEVGGNLIPVPFGAGDWIDTATFPYSRNGAETYDIIMVASWLSFKRHRLLFRELKRIADQVNRVALVGYPLKGRTRLDIEREAREEGVLDKIDIHERVPFAEVARLLGHSKIAVMLTRREGANKAFYEALFSNVPVLVTDQNQGMNRDHINPATGVLAGDAEVGQKILALLRNRDAFRPRAWALENTGAQRTSAALNLRLREIAQRAGEPWTIDIAVKKNAPNLAYVEEEDRLRLEPVYAILDTFRR